MDMIEEGWQQINSGTSLIAWSWLAKWDSQALCFVPASQDDFKAAYVDVHRSYGRLICWLTFAVGVEYLCRGVCLLEKLDVFDKNPIDVIRAPRPGEDLQQWVKLVNQETNGDPEVREKEQRSKTLRQLADEVRKIEALGKNKNRVAASIKFLASTIRNRDAHRYVVNVREFHFSTIPDLLVPSLNDLLRVTDQSELKMHLSGVALR